MLLGKKGMIVFTVRAVSAKNYGERRPPDNNGRDLTSLLTVCYYWRVPVDPRVGALHSVDEKYFKRIEAIEYTVKHDDGKSLTALNDADIVLVGISRTSKTPLSIFLSHKGWKVANIPLVLNQQPPKELFAVDHLPVFMIDADTLLRIRRKRLEKSLPRSG